MSSQLDRVSCTYHLFDTRHCKIVLLQQDLIRIRAEIVGVCHNLLGKCSREEEYLNCGWENAENVLAVKDSVERRYLPFDHRRLIS